MNFWRFVLLDANSPAEVAEQYDSWLVALSVAIAVAGAFALLRAVERFKAAETPGMRRSWAMSGAVSMGFGIWAMHFTGMIAVMMPFGMEYDVALTALSLLPAVGGSLAAMYVLGVPKPNAWKLHRGALVLGGSIGAMHYVGMEAMRFAGTLRYDPWLFALSVFAAYALALIALHIRPAPGTGVGGRQSHSRALASACLLGGAVAGMHYIAMIAARFEGVEATMPPHVHAPPFVVEGVVFGMVLILAVVWVGSIFDRRLAAAGASLRRGEAQHRAAIDSMSDAHFLADSTWRILSLNPAAATMFGHAAPELVGVNLGTLVPQMQTAGDPATRFLGKRQRGLLAVRKDGEHFPIERVVTGFDMDGEQFFSCTVRDLSEYSATMETTKRLMAAIDQAPDGIAILDATMLLIYANPKFWALAGSDPKESLGRRLEDLAPTSVDDAVLAQMYSEIRAGKAWAETVATTQPDGSTRHEALSTSPVVTDGRVGCYIHTRRDLTEQVRMEQQLRHAQKLESIGQLSAGIAHELNTPSQFVRDNIVFLKDGYAQLITLIDRVSDPAVAVDPAALAAAIEAADLAYLRDEIPRAIDQSVDGMNRITKIVRAMKEFSHQNKEKTPSNINNAIESTITVATNEWKYVADLELDLDPALPLVPCLLDEFNQVVLNLVVNAAHAIADAKDVTKNEKGKITISTRTLPEYVEVRIEDTGTGMKPEIKARIFEPFFTTKQVGRGTGQGLSIAYAVIVEKHGGSIDVETELGKGSCFVVRLPLSGAKQRPANAAA